MTFAMPMPRLLPTPPLPDPGARWALFLDVDGTLLGFNADPERVVLSAPLRATLERLHAELGGALALVSGRHLDELDRLFGAPFMAAAGLHGLQRRRRDGSLASVQIDPTTITRLHRAVAALQHELPNMGIEDKGMCVGLHFRTAPQLAGRITDGAQAIAAQLPGYTLQHGNHIVDIRPQGTDKGDAIDAFMAEAPFIGRTPIHLGDDLTDEPAFAAVNAVGGTSIRVGSREPTVARHTLADPAAVQDWLQRLAQRLAQPEPAARSRSGSG